MMRSIFVFIWLLPVSAILFSQEKDPQKITEAAKVFARKGDLNNAILILNRGLESDKNNLTLLKDLAFYQFMKKDYAAAMETAKPFALRKDADEQAFQILAMAYKSLEEYKECDRMYKLALKKYPKSGVLHSEYGELLWREKLYNDAIRLWEKGIQQDPNYPGNYYHAARHYFSTNEKIWGLLYGEIFINLESFTERTIEIKGLLMEGYKKLYIDKDLQKNQNTNNEFANACLGIYQQLSDLAAGGIFPESITALRTRFILDWSARYAERYPYRLFDHHRQLLRLGLFNAYNQWIFGAAVNLQNYEAWVKAHPEEQAEFQKLQQNRVFKLPDGQYYQRIANK
jgi:tetratricopeptide (TPR) repeat protein